MWFKTLTGFSEQSPQQVRENIEVTGTKLRSLVNDEAYEFGRLETPSLQELRGRIPDPSGKLSLKEVVASVQDLHEDTASAGAMFQVASQFNLLEMVSPQVTPEMGVGIYERDRTQGPACAISAGAGTIYRNYFASVVDQVGQTANSQIDCLADLGNKLGNTNEELWKMTNGYALASESGLRTISKRLQDSDEADRDELRKLLRIGIQWNTQVTLPGCKHLVSQAYCSALPVAYSRLPDRLWADFALLILEASYEATFCAAIVNANQTGNNKVYLTLLGGGAFGNSESWIIKAIERAAYRHRDHAIDVSIVSYGSSHRAVKELVQRW